MDSNRMVNSAKTDIALLKSNFVTTIVSKIVTSMIAKQGIDAKVYVHSVSLEHSDASKRVKLHVDASVDVSEDDIYKLVNNI